MGPFSPRTIRRLTLLLFLILPGCFLPRQTETPVGTIWYSEPGTRHSTLLVLFPGIYDDAYTFEEHDFIAMIRESGLQADAVAVDAHLGYYLDRTLVTRISKDVMEQAAARGYSHIWLAGISLGGLGVLWYDKERPGDAERLIALSPYLGDEKIVRQVAAACGVEKWHPRFDGDEDQEFIWRMVKAYETPKKSAGRLFLGYGLDDDFARSNALLAQLIVPDQVIAIEGGHDWPTWKKLWREFLQRLR